jgi:hypothetical protein
MGKKVKLVGSSTSVALGTSGLVLGSLYTVAGVLEGNLGRIVGGTAVSIAGATALIGCDEAGDYADDLYSKMKEKAKELKNFKGFKNVR